MVPTLRNFKLIIAYDGSGYYGWQVQQGRRTVQETVEQALATILKQDVRITASGRTDTGVHALGQVANFTTSSSIPEEGLLRALNSLLPSDLAVTDVEVADVNFHARRMAKAKSYAYVMDTSRIMSPLLSRYALHVPGPIDVESMNRAAQMLLGEHDFSSFMGSGSGVKTTIRNIMAAEIVARGAKLFFYIQGSGFLRHMVRNIVGTLILVGQGKIEPEEIMRIMALKNRSLAGPTAPPQGLYLVGVDYGSSHLGDSRKSER